MQAKQTARDVHAAKKTAAEKQASRESVTVGEAWLIYRKARKSKWSDGHYDDHIANSSTGGQDKKRGKGQTRHGALASLLPVRLVDLNSARITSWLETESLTRPTAAALSYRMLRAFIRWTNEQPAYEGMRVIPLTPYLASLLSNLARRSEWVKMPAGISAQIMEHKPSAIAEKHYRRRPLDLLRVWHEKMEAWMLMQAGIVFVPAQTGLRVVTN